jgi:hypothetical protein
MRERSSSMLTTRSVTEFPKLMETGHGLHLPDAAQASSKSRSSTCASRRGRLCQFRSLHPRFRLHYRLRYPTSRGSSSLDSTSDTVVLVVDLRELEFLFKRGRRALRVVGGSGVRILGGGGHRQPSAAVPHCLLHKQRSVTVTRSKDGLKQEKDIPNEGTQIRTSAIE